MFKKICPKFHDKAVQSNILWLNLNKINAEVFYNQEINNKVTLHFMFMRWAKNTDLPMHSNSISCPKIFPLSAQVLYWLSDMHLEPESEKQAKNIDFHTAKNIQIQKTLFRCIKSKTYSYKLTSNLFTVV